MSLHPLLYAELHELLEAVCRGDATAAQLARLEEMAGGNPDARAFYVEYLDIHAQLRWSAGDQGPAERGGHPEGDQQEEGAVQMACGRSLPRALPAARSPVLGFLGRLLRAGNETPVSSALMWLVMAIVCSGVVLTFFFCITLIFHGVGGDVHHDGPELAGNREQAVSPFPAAGSPAPSRGSVARLIRAYDCRWAVGSHSPHVGDDLEPGRKLALMNGLAEIMFQSGVRAVLQGPAEMEIGSRRSALLRQGKLTVNVEDPDAHGFEIDAPGMKYTDLGTEFGVFVAKDGRQEMLVFRGQVQAEQSMEQGAAQPGREQGNRPSPQFPGPRSLLLSAHQAISVAAPGKPIERVVADEKEFVRTGEVIKFVADNSPEFHRWKQFSDALRKRPDLAAYYDFQPDDSDRTILRNHAGSGKKLDGRIEGAKWSDGHVPGKNALEFSGSGDRVRVNIPGRFDVFTAAAWINIRGLPKDYCGILMSDRWFLQVGQCHWTLRPDGGLSLRPCHSAVRKATPAGFETGSSGPVLRAEDFGAWCHVAVVYDSRTQTSVHYRNGRAYGTQKFASRIPLVFGPSQVCNWLPDLKSDTAARNLPGRMDELLIMDRALSADEIKGLYENSSGADLIK
jgi:hypothetical protein